MALFRGDASYEAEVNGGSGAGRAKTAIGDAVVNHVNPFRWKVRVEGGGDETAGGDQGCIEAPEGGSG